MPNATLVSPRDVRHANIIDPTHGAQRSSLRPPERSGYGSYSISMSSGLVAAGMAGPLPIWEMRWFPADGTVALIRRLRFSAAAATLFTAGIAVFDLFRATGMSVLDTTGAAGAITLLGKSQARSSRFAQSKLQSSAGQGFAILNTANTGLTAGTKTLDNNAIAGIAAGVPVTAGTGNTWIVPPGTLLLEPSEGGKEPVELQSNEGLILRAVSIPATGTWTFTVDVDWDEVDPKTYFA